MKSYSVKAINLGGFNLGESDKVVYVFTAERGFLKAVAKGARKPGTKMSGRTEALFVQELHLAPGKTFEIITQAQSIDTLSELRTDFARLTYGMYYAELSLHFAHGLQEDSAEYFDFLVKSLTLLARNKEEPIVLSLAFQMGLLKFQGMQPELHYCINCRILLTEYILARFSVDLGGIVCSNCSQQMHNLVREQTQQDNYKYDQLFSLKSSPHISSLVWKVLQNVANSKEESFTLHTATTNDSNSSWQVKINLSTSNNRQVLEAAQRLLQNYIECKAGKQFKSLSLLDSLPTL